MKFQEQAKKYFKQYHNSDDWRQKEVAFLSFGLTCEVCGEKACKIYHSVIRYPVNCETEKDLIPLCEKHYKMAVDLEKKGRIPPQTLCKTAKKMVKRRRIIIEAMKKIEKIS